MDATILIRYLPPYYFKQTGRLKKFLYFIVYFSASKTPSHKVEGIFQRLFHGLLKNVDTLDLRYLQNNTAKGKINVKSVVFCKPC